MKEFVFSEIEKINDFQFINDNEGFFLSDKGSLYHFSGMQSKKMFTPQEYQPTKIVFSDELNGAIAGNGGTVENLIQKSSFESSSIAIVMLIILVLLVKRLKIFAKKRTMVSMATTLLLLISVFYSCRTNWESYRYKFPDSEFITGITNNRGPDIGLGFHSYMRNKGQTAFISITKDGGKTWKSYKLPTDFYVTDLISVGNNYYVSTYANELFPENSLHEDGEIWIYGNDSSFCNKLKHNINYEHPASFDIKRGIKGMRMYEKDSLFFAFGSEHMRYTWPKDEINQTAGNIFKSHTNFLAPYQIIDLPDTALVTSLGLSDSREIWVTLDNKKQRVNEYIALDKKQLLCFDGKKWIEKTIEKDSSFNQIALSPYVPFGYALSESGCVYQTSDSGKTWQKTNLISVEKIKINKSYTTLLKESKHLICINH